MFEDAKRSQAYMRVGLTGPSGSGKTMSALLMAYGLVGDWSKIGIVCSEGGSGELYANYNRNGIVIGQYKIHKLTPPYEPKKYIAAINVAVKSGLKAIILDTISHAWAGAGGLLDKQGKLADSAKFNSFTAWRMVTPEHNSFIDAMIQSPIHIIATLRVKTDWVIEQDEKGKNKPRKIGLAPVQRDGMDYEFTVVFDLAHNHSVTVSKDRTGLFDGKIFVPVIETGREMLAWLNEAEPTKPDSDAEKTIKSEPEKAVKSEPEKTDEKQETVSELSEQEPDSYPTIEIVLGRRENLVEFGGQVFRTARFSDKTIGAIFAVGSQSRTCEDLKTLRGGASYTVTVWDEIPEGERPGLPDTLQKGRLVMIGEITAKESAVA